MRSDDDASSSGLRSALYVLAAALAAHVASLRAGFVLDDWELLVENPYLRSASGLRVLFTRELFAATGEPRLVPYYRPVTSFVYWLTYQLFGANALLHHTFNVALHGVCAVTFFFLARAVSISSRAALVIALLFAVHPMSAELVAYTGGRQDVLGWTIAFGSMLAIARARDVRRIAIVAFAGTLLAALSREFFLSLPAMLVVAAFASSAWKNARPRAAIAAGGGGALAIAVVLGLRAALHITAFTAGSKSFAQVVGCAAAVLLRLVKDVVAPTDLAVIVTIEPLGAGAGLAVLVIAGAALFGGLRAVRASKPDLAVAYGIGAVGFVVLVVLHTTIALPMSLFSDRYGYGAVALIALCLAPVVEIVAARAKDLRPAVRIAAAVGVVVAIAPFTWARAADYASDETLALATVRDRPDDPQALLAEVAALRGAGKKEEAYPLCHRYAERLPRSLATNPCLAEEAIAAHDYLRAAKLLEPWVYSHPGDASARGAYFDALFRSGDLPRIRTALEYFEPVEPNAPDVRAAREAFDRAKRGE